MNTLYYSILLKYASGKPSVSSYSGFYPKVEASLKPPSSIERRRCRSAQPFDPGFAQ